MLWPPQLIFHHYTSKCNIVWVLRRRRINFPVSFHIPSTSFLVYNVRTGSETNLNVKSTNNRRISPTSKWWKSLLKDAHTWALRSRHIRNGYFRRLRFWPDHKICIVRNGHFVKSRISADTTYRVCFMPSRYSTCFGVAPTPINWNNRCRYMPLIHRSAYRRF